MREPKTPFLIIKAPIVTTNPKPLRQAMLQPYARVGGFRGKDSLQWLVDSLAPLRDTALYALKLEALFQLFELGRVTINFLRKRRPGGVHFRVVSFSQIFF